MVSKHKVNYKNNWYFAENNVNEAGETLTLVQASPILSYITSN